MKDLTRDFQEEEQCSFHSLAPEHQQAIIDHEQVWGTLTNREWMAITEVAPGLYIGGEAAVKDNILRYFNIKTVLNMAFEVNDVEIDGVDMWKLGFFDGDLPPKAIWPKAAEIIHNGFAAGPVLVHCVAGISRSVTAAIAYMMIYKKMGWKEAFQLIVSQRRCAYPHPILMRGLVRDLGADFIP
jgi:protein-tyrosine phosphatase